MTTCPVCERDGKPSDSASLCVPCRRELGATPPLTKQRRLDAYGPGSGFERTDGEVPDEAWSRGAAELQESGP